MKYEGLDLLNNHFLNKGTAFTKEERKRKSHRRFVATIRANFGSTSRTSLWKLF